MLFRPPIWLLGVGMALESMRRGFVGGTGLSLFIIKDFGFDWQGREHCQMLRDYLEIEAMLLEQIPDWLTWLFWIFQDYHDAAVTYVTILEELVEYQDPQRCSWYWENA